MDDDVFGDVIPNQTTDDDAGDVMRGWDTKGCGFYREICAMSAASAGHLRDNSVWD